MALALKRALAMIQEEPDRTLWPVDGFAQTVRFACWMDKGQSAEFVQDVRWKMLSLKCTGYLYGTDMLVRIMKLELDCMGWQTIFFVAATD